MLKRFLLRFAYAAVAFIAAFWLCRFGGWLNSLTTVRTPFYFSMVKVMAWFWASVAAFIVYLNSGLAGASK